MDEMEFDIKEAANKKLTIAVITFVLFCAVMWYTYKNHLAKIERMTEAVALAQLEALPAMPPKARFTAPPAPTPNGKVEPVEAVEVITDEQTGGVVESTEGPGQIKQNTGE